MITSQRELELQSIIRTLESQAHAQQLQVEHLEQEIQEKVTQAIQRERKINHEKDKTIALLMEEGQKSSQQSQHKHSRNIAIIEDQYKSREENHLQMTTHKMHLETRLQQITKEKDQKITEKDK